MDVAVIGKNIAKLRKSKGIRQEELARFVGVSTQAVSKWENGGAPDCELLPIIADYFKVSIDSLFDRDFFDSTMLKSVLQAKISKTPEKERFDVAFEYCWEIEKGLFGISPDDISIKDRNKSLSDYDRHHSELLTDLGFTQMEIANWYRYFLIVPDIKDTDKALFDGIDYPSFFADISDKDVFSALCLLYGRDSAKSFTLEYLSKNLNISEEIAGAVIKVISKYGLIKESILELDEDTVIYKFNPIPSFVPLLIFAREIIKPWQRGSYVQKARKKPYLN